MCMFYNQEKPYMFSIAPYRVGGKRMERRLR
jgi:hypothetical protein